MELGATYCAPAGSGMDDRDPLKEYYQSTKLARAILSIKKQGKDTSILDMIETLSTTTTTTTTRDGCQLCDPNGVLSVLEQLHESITADFNDEQAAKCGHVVLPMEPPKTEKRDEELAMAVLYCYDSLGHKEDQVRYLMVKRPSSGLLAGQWEFPNVCVHIRNNKKGNTKVKSKPPTKVERGQALTSYLLEDIFIETMDHSIAATISQMSREVRNESIEHVFSHVRHIMWVEVGQLPVVDLGPTSWAWTSSAGRQVRWMNSGDMEKVGITSGVKKVLQTVQSKLCGKSMKSASKKRKR
jgi:adenine-specific DNA glycosylase